MNDDFQVLLWHNPQSFFDCLKVFTSTDFTNVYWRPVPAFINSCSVFFGGYSAVTFHSVSIFFYLLTSYAVYAVLTKFNISRTIALISTLIFSVLPAHEMQVAWITGRNDSVMLLFAVLSLSYYVNTYDCKSKSNYILSSFFLLCAFLCKEHAFALCAVPFMVSYYKSGRFFSKKSLFSFVTACLLVLAILAYRNFVIGGTPLSSGNFNDLTLLNAIKSFFFYIPLVFLTPDTFLNLFIITLLAVLFIGTAIIIIYHRKKFSELLSEHKRSLIFGLLWFCILIIPALPLMMRWYAFMPSLGILIIISFLLVFLQKVLNKLVFYILSVLIISIFCLVNMQRMSDWSFAGKQTREILSKLPAMKLPNNSRVFVWGLPDKINDINVFKLGTQQAFIYTLGKEYKNMNVFDPLKTIYSDYASLSFIKEDSLSFTLMSLEAHFIPFGKKYNPNNLNEPIEIKDENYNLKIINSSYNTASINLKSNRDIIHLIFTGKEFIRF